MMSDHARRRLLMTLLATAGLTLGAGASAQAPDTRPIRLIVPYPAGGPADIVARAIAQPLSEELGRSIVIDNRPGASGMIGATAVAKSAPDGTTLLLNPTIHIILPSLKQDISYEAIDDFTHLGVTVGVPLILAVNNDLPVRSVKELVEHARQNPGKLSFATSSLGSSSHLAGEQLKLMGGADILHVPYKGSAPAITDLVGGQVQMMFDSLPSIYPFVKNGRLRALAVTTPQRSAAAPDLPTMEEAGFPGFDHTNWYGIWGPRGMPSSASDPIIQGIQKTMARPDFREKILNLGAQPLPPLSGEQFKRFVASEKERYAKLVKEAGIRVE